MAAEVRKTYPDARVDLVRSSGGRFEVSRDGAPVFEKSKLGRFPDTGEVVRLLAAK